MHVFEKEFIDVSNCKVLGDYTVIKEENGILVISKDSNYGLANLQGKIIHDIKLKKVLQIKDGLVVVENNKGSSYSVIDEYGNTVISSDNMFEIKNNFIVEITDCYADNGYDIYDKRGNLIIDEIEAYSDSILVRKIEDGFDKLYYELYDLKGKKVIELSSSFNTGAFISLGIIQYRKKNNVYILNDDGTVIKKFKGIDVKIIDDNRYLVYSNLYKWKLIDGNKNTLFKSREHADIDYENKIVMIGDFYELEGFINIDNKYIDFGTTVEKCDVINKDYLLIKYSDYIKVIDLNGNVLISIENLGSNIINYNEHYDVYRLRNNHECSILDNKFNTIFKCEAYNIEIITDKLYLVQKQPDSDTLLINSNNKIIHTFKSNISDMNIEIRGNLIKITGKKQIVFDIDGEIIVPATDDNIVLLSLNRLIINNKLIDLNSEYLDINACYSVSIDLFDKRIIRKFNSIKEKKLFIEEVSKIEKEYSSKIDLIKNDAFDNLEKVYKKVKDR